MNSPDGTASQTAATDSSGNNDATQTPAPAPKGAGAQLGDLVNEHAKGFEGFDPAIHATDSDGRPIAKKGGGWQKKRGGNMRLHAAPAQTPANDASAAPKPQRVVAQVNTTEAAKATLNAAVSLMVLVFGEQWAPQAEQERVALVGALKNYFDAKGAVEVSPGWGLALVVAAYSVPRLKHEATLSKLQKIRVGLAKFAGWIAGKFSRA